MIGLMIWAGLSASIYVASKTLKVLVVDDMGFIITPFTLSLVWPIILLSALLSFMERILAYMYRGVYLAVFLLTRGKKGGDDENHISH